MISPRDAWLPGEWPEPGIARVQSCLYLGNLRHRRFAPRAHEFSYPLFMVYLDLAELDVVFRGRWLWSTTHPTLAWLRRKDYLGDPALPLDRAVRDAVSRATGSAPVGPIRMLTHLRYFGHCFNPVTFYYCYDAEGVAVHDVVAEITNTPWNERHTYVLRASPTPTPGRRLRFDLEKRFHVSPFMPMALTYDWRFSTPAQRLAVHMQSLREGRKIFDATLDLTRREIDGPSLARTLARQPAMTARVIAGIYWQALRLWMKRVPFHSHPDGTSVSPTSGERTQ